MDELGTHLLRLYRNGRLTKKAIKDALVEASREQDIRNQALLTRRFIRELRYLVEIPDDERFLREYFRMTHWDLWHSDGSGI